MRHAFCDPDVLQRIRLEIAACPDREIGLDGLADVGADKLKLHLERLFYGGELVADAHVGPDGLRITPRRLTPYGVLAMHAALAKGRARRAI